ncbi:MAG: sugar phosphate isomerase/epimerase [Longimicrobiales bacterium]|nr:sugar phosphate isomerase/epimerase [Longimicrobiales bacterium]
MITRREALRRLGVLAAGAAGAGAAGMGTAGCSGEDRPGRRVPSGAPSGEASGARSGGGSGEPIGPLGVQLYTVRDQMQADVARTLARVAGIGYREVEFAGYFGHAPREIRAMLDDTGLRAPAAHIAVEALTDEWEATLETANAVGHDHLVVAWIPEPMRGSLDAWRRTADLFTRAGETARAAGLGLAYHNHDFEFHEMEGRVPFDVFCEESDPELVRIELDIFWITHGGGDALAFFERWPGRVPMVHVKGRTPEGEMVDVGQGAIEWAEVLGRHEEAGIRHYFVEHDTPDDSLASIEASYRYLSGLRV